MPLIKLFGTSPELTIHFERPILVNAAAAAATRLALVGFYTDNYVNNLREQDVVSFFFDSSLTVTTATAASEKIKYETEVDIKPLQIPPGYYSMDDLQTLCRNHLTANFSKVNANDFRIHKSSDGYRVVVVSPVEFYMGPHVSHLLGFEPTPPPPPPPTPPDNTPLAYLRKNNYRPANTTAAAMGPPNMRPLDAIEIHCDVIEHGLKPHDDGQTHAETGLLYHFYPDSPHEYKISEVPYERLYVPIRRNLREIRAITVSVRDQLGRLLQQSASVNYTVYLDLL